MKTSRTPKQTPPPVVAGDVLEFLQNMGSDVHVITLANLIWGAQAEMGLVRDRALVHMWENGIESIRRNQQEALAAFKKRLEQFDPLAAKFLSDIEKATSPVVMSLLNKIIELQDRISRSWKSKLPENAFFPALELLFREGEIMQFREGQKTLQKRIRKSFAALCAEMKKKAVLTHPDASKAGLSDQRREQYGLITTQTIEAMRYYMDLMMSFYDRKWALFLSPEKGREVWIQK